MMFHGRSVRLLKKPARTARLRQKLYQATSLYQQRTGAYWRGAVASTTTNRGATGTVKATTNKIFGEHLGPSSLFKGPKDSREECINRLRQ